MIIQTESTTPSMDKSKISVLDLKRLLFDLRDSGTDTCIRFRTMGEMWQATYGRILTLTDKGVILDDDSKTILIADINAVIQFELDKTFRQYQPHFHYRVEP